MNKSLPNSTKYTVHAFTDGAASNNHKPEIRVGGWATVMMYVDAEGNLHPGKPGQDPKKEFSGTVPGATNNQMELQAILVSLQSLKTDGTEITIVTDSEYAIGALVGGNKVNQNKELIAQIKALMAKHKVTFEKVKGHAGHDGNERANKLAQTAAGSKSK